MIEYGDGGHTTEPVSFHKSDRTGDLAARVVAADRSGRVSVTTTPLPVNSLTRWGGCSAPSCYWITGSFPNPVTGQDETRYLVFTAHEGRAVAGTYRHPGGGISAFHGLLSGENEMSLVLDLGGIEFTGAILSMERLRLLLRGGSADGLTLDFFYYDGPG